MSHSQTISPRTADPVLHKAFWMRMLHGSIAPPEVHVKWVREAETVPGLVSVTQDAPINALNSEVGGNTPLAESDCLGAMLMAIYRYTGQTDLLAGLAPDNTQAGKQIEDSLLPLRFLLQEQASVSQMRASLASIVRKMRDNSVVRSASLRWQPPVPSDPDGWPKLNAAVLPNWNGGPLPPPPNGGFVIAFSSDSEPIRLAGNFDQRNFDQQGAAGFLSEVGVMTNLLLDNSPILIAALREAPGQAAMAGKQQHVDEGAMIWSEETARALAAGGKTLAASAELQDPPALLRALQQRKPAIVELTPYIMAGLLEHVTSLNFEERHLTNLRCAVVRGEPISTSLLNEWLVAYPHVVVVQVLGIGFECPAAVIQRPVSAQHLLFPIFPNNNGHIEIRIGSKPALAGVPGEIWLKEPDNSVAFRDPALHAINETANSWRTSGECGKYLPGEGIEWTGRLAQPLFQQNWMRGIHLEAALNAHPSIRNCAVVSPRNAGPDSPLLANIICRRGARPEASELADYVRCRLGASFEFEIRYAETFPLLGDGRIDRDTLRKTPADDGSPRNAVDEVLVALWSEMLKVSHVGIHDDFFALGGHSVLAMQITARIRRIFQTEISLRSVFEASSITHITDMLIASEKLPGQAERLARIWQRACTMSADELKQLLAKTRTQS
jgi:hypothetical protein